MRPGTSWGGFISGNDSAESAEDRGERGGELHKESGHQPQGAEKKGELLPRLQFCPGGQGLEEREQFPSESPRSESSTRVQFPQRPLVREL